MVCVEERSAPYEEEKSDSAAQATAKKETTQVLDF
jgi:hypothetical protein